MNTVVQQLGQLNFIGTTIPYTWFQHPLLRSDKTESCPEGILNTDAVIILSEIVDLYLPEYSMYEGSRSKFSGKVLVINYAEFGARSGLPADQVRDAFLFLEAKGIIRLKEKDTHSCKNGSGEKVVIENAVLVEPILKSIMDLNGYILPGDAELQSNTSKQYKASTPADWKNFIDMTMPDASQQEKLEKLEILMNKTANSPKPSTVSSLGDILPTDGENS